MRTSIEYSIDQFNQIVTELHSQSDITFEEAQNLAVKIQTNIIRQEFNDMYAAAHVVNLGSPVPSALEKIAMELEKFNNNK